MDLKNNKIFTNNGSQDFEELLIKLSNQADKIEIATAFFSETNLINYWLRNHKVIDLLISLRPPTNYYSLLKIHSNSNVNIQFLGRDFHSKFFIFYRYDKPFASIIGSSNFTVGGIYKNIETNANIDDLEYLKELSKEFSSLWNNSYKLQPSDLEAYKAIFEKSKKNTEKENKEQEEFEKKITKDRLSIIKSPRISRDAKEYNNFWIVVNEIRGMVSEISKEEYPDIPIYLVIDHFWHWLKVIWDESSIRLLFANDKTPIIKNLFKKYCLWDKSNDCYTEQMAEKSKTIFSFLLSENKIDDLTPDDAKKIISNLHSGSMRTKRFGADTKFITENSIKQIRLSLKYLLYSNQQVEVRIHNLCSNPNYKLNQLSRSGIQELLGWVMPEKYPIRNEKANSAIEMLGYSYK